MSRQAHPLVQFAIDRRITMTMAVLGILVMGATALTRLPLEFLPAFSSSSITVRASYRSSSPEEIERLIVMPLEGSLSTINGIDTLSASATADSARIRITFVDGTDMDMAAVDVRDRLDRVRHLLPDDLERINIRRFQSSDIPVIQFDLSADWPAEDLFDYAELVVQPRLERLEGVAQVSVNGIRTPQIQIDLDPDRLQAHGIDVRALSGIIASSNINISAGDIRSGSRKLLVRAEGELATLDAIRGLPVRGPELRLSDLADVTYTLPRQESFNFLNGVEALTVRVNKTSTANILAVARRVKDELKAIGERPDAQGLQTRVFRDASRDVEKGLAQLWEAGLLGGALAILAVFGFVRRVRTTLLVALAIPLSVVATFVLMHLMRQSGFMDITLNVVSLAGLMLALGMLVDSSVVVIESIFRHRSELGQDARTAALIGGSEVTLPILASTATTLCVFIPLVFLDTGGRMRIYLQNIAATVSLVIVAAMVVALTVIPMVASFLLRHETARPSRVVDALTGVYGRALQFTLRHRFAFVVVISLLLWGSIHLFGTIERSHSGGTDERQVLIHVDTPRQYGEAEITALYRELYDLFDSRRDELDIADIAFAYDRQTGRSRASWRRDRRFELYLVDEEEGKHATSEVRETIRALLPSRSRGQPPHRPGAGSSRLHRDRDRADGRRSHHPGAADPEARLPAGSDPRASGRRQLARERGRGDPSPGGSRQGGQGRALQPRGGHVDQPLALEPAGQPPQHRAARGRSHPAVPRGPEGDPGAARAPSRLPHHQHPPPLRPGPLRADRRPPVHRAGRTTSRRSRYRPTPPTRRRPSPPCGRWAR